MIKLLRAEGLLPAKIIEPVLDNQPEIELDEERSFGRAPRATRDEMKMRELINLERMENNQDPVNWRNLKERIAVLAPRGIIVTMPDPEAENQGEGETFDGKISLTDPAI